jgi:hypothetical protein
LKNSPPAPTDANAEARPLEGTAVDARNDGVEASPLSASPGASVPTDEDLEAAIVRAVLKDEWDLAKELRGQLTRRREARAGNVLALPLKRPTF